MSTSEILRVENLRKHFGGVQASDGVNLSIARGDIVAIIGPNGCGKSTFLNLCTGYLAPDAGKILFEGTDLAGQSPRRIARLGVGRAFQLPQLFTEHTVIDNLLIAVAARHGFWRPLSFLRNSAAQEQARQLLAILAIKSVADRSIVSLPEGVRKLVDIGLALAQQPRLLFLDEPTSGVSSQDKFGIMDTLCATLRELNVTAVLVEHDMDLIARYADRVVAWERGRIVADGLPGEILARAHAGHASVEAAS